MNDTPTFQVMNPLAKTIEEGEEIIEQIRTISDRLEACIADERTWYGHMKDAEAAYEAAELEELADALVLAQAKEGPLAGVAATSKAFDILLNNLKNKLRTGKLAREWQTFDRIRRSYDNSQIDLRQTETQFNALRKIADVKTQTLRASTI
ncbi:MAG: hypothetical protein IT328_23025 [Caldilineaceae bacterium]|nr:hypothetical protein [Caldilineaceae bacterium]